MVPLYLLINCYLQNSYGSDDKEFGCNAGDLGSIPVLGGSPIEGNGNPLPYPFLENSMDREAWWARVYNCRLKHRGLQLAKSWTQLSG